MALPNFDSKGELPAGVHQEMIDEVFARFGGGSLQRQAVTENLRKIYEATVATGKLERLIIFGSYVTNKPNPNDVDVVLIFRDDFDVTTCDDETKKFLITSEQHRILVPVYFGYALRYSFLILWMNLLHIGKLNEIEPVVEL